jgi:hypothetical protein
MCGRLKTFKMEKRIDQLLIRVQGKMYLGQKLEIDQDVTLILKGSITDENVSSNQDGSVNICAVFRAISVEIKA